MHVLASSKVYVYISVDAPPGVDPTAYPPEACLIPDKGEEPVETDWHPATWIGGEIALLVGPGGGTVYPEGDYFAFVRLTAGVEKPVMPSGRVRVGMP